MVISIGLYRAKQGTELLQIALSAFESKQSENINSVS